MTTPQNILILPTLSLKPHPLNKELYSQLEEDSPQFVQLLDSMKAHGVLQPLQVRPDGTILSGHRRLSVALKLGMTALPVILVEGGDDRLLLVENNRYRHKTSSELMREAELIEKVVAEKAALNQSRAGEARDTTVAEPINTREVVADAIGMGARTFSKLKKVYEAAKTNENAAEKMARIDKGDLSIDAAYKSLRTLMGEETTETVDEETIPEFIRFYNSLYFVESDPRFGIPHPGRIASQISANLIYYYTEPGDLVVDPMAGGGSTLDTALFLEREVLAYDLVPKRPDIIQWDISKGFPEETKGCQLIFLDPPYWNTMDYGESASSSLSFEDFTGWYKNLLLDASHTVKVGGFVATIIVAQYFRLPPELESGYMDWPVLAYNTLVKSGMVPWSRINVLFPVTAHTEYHMNAAKKGKYMLPITGDIIIMRRVR